jgi:hypothetical protein
MMYCPAIRHFGGGLDAIRIIEEAFEGVFEGVMGEVFVGEAGI